MMKAMTLLIASAAMLSWPAQAQLLGSGGGLGGLTGGLGQSVSGTLGGGLNSSVSKSVDRRSGRAHGSASADGTLSGTLDSMTNAAGPNGKSITASKSLRTEKRVSKSATVEGGAPGTDDGRGLVGNIAGTSRGAIGGATKATKAAASGAEDHTGHHTTSGRGSIFGNGETVGNASSVMLGGAGSLAGSTSGTGAIEAGTLVRDAKGRTIGRVEELRETSGTVLVSVGDHVAELPAVSLSANGTFATSAMTKGEIKKQARKEARATDNTKTS